MDEEQLQRELARLTARLERIERILQINAAPPVAPPVQRPAWSPPQYVQPHEQVRPPEFARAPQPAAPPARPAAAAPISAPLIPSVAPATMRSAYVAPAPPTATQLRASPSRPPLASKNAIEVFIGGKGMAWVGAIAVVLAAAFGIMVGIDKGWWGRLSPELRCLGIAAFGAALIAGGELALRRIGKAASVGLFGAGLGTLYLDAFATSKYFNLLSLEVAFVLMAIVAAIGFAITLRTRFTTIGVLSIVGGYLTPVLLRGSSTHDLQLLAYLTMLLGVSLGLSAAVPLHFRALRYVALGGQGLIGFAWLVSNSSEWKMAMVFMTIWWSMVLGEAVYAAMRRQSPLGNVVAVILATAGYATAGCWLLYSATPPVSGWLGVFTAMIAVVGMAVALQFGPGLDALRQPPRQAIDKLSVALWALAGALVVIAIALQFEGFAQSVAWLALALAAIEAGRRLPSRGVTWFGLIVGALALFRILTIDWWITSGMIKPFWSAGSVSLTRWSILLLIAMVAAHVAAHRVREVPNSKDRMPVVLAVIGSLLWILFCQTQFEELAVTAGWLAGAAALLAMARIGWRQKYFEIAGGTLATSVVRWLIIDAMLNRLSPGWRGAQELPLMNAQVAIALVILALGWWVHRIAKDRREDVDDGTTRRPSELAQRWTLAGMIFSLIALSFEVDRVLAGMGQSPWPGAQRLMLWLTALWGFGGFVMAIIGWRRALPLLLKSGGIFLGAAAIAWLSVDTISWRLWQAPADVPVLFNLQFGIGVLLIALLGWSAHLLIRHDSIRELLLQPPATQILHGFLALIAAMGLWLGSLELDRLFADRPMMLQTGLSVYWGLYGVALVLIGFVKRATAARYAGLGLLTLTLAKVLFIDMRGIDLIWRALSFAAIGLLLIGTSIAYARLAPRLLGERQPDGVE